MCMTAGSAVQELLRPNRMLVSVLGLFTRGIPHLMQWAHPCAMLARTAVQLLAAMPAPATFTAKRTQKLSANLLGAAGQVWTSARPQHSFCLLVQPSIPPDTLFRIYHPLLAEMLNSSILDILSSVNISCKGLQSAPSRLHLRSGSMVALLIK